MLHPGINTTKGYSAIPCWFRSGRMRMQGTGFRLYGEDLGQQADTRRPTTICPRPGANIGECLPPTDDGTSSSACRPRSSSCSTPSRPRIGPDGGLVREAIELLATRYLASSEVGE